MPDTSPPASPRRRRSAGRIAALVAGGLAALVALLMLAAGGALLWGNAQKDHDGYLHTGTDRFHTRTAAIATDNLDVETGGASDLLGHDLFGKVRVRAESHTGKPVFVGIARTAEVDRYLRGTAHAIVTDVDTSPFTAKYRTVPAAVTTEQRAAIVGADVITFTSSSTVDRFVDAVGADGVPPVVACIGPVTAATAREHDLTVDVEAKVHTVAGLVDALVEWAST